MTGLTLKGRLEEILKAAEATKLKVRYITIDSDENGYGNVEYNIHATFGNVGDLELSPMPPPVLDHSV